MSGKERNNRNVSHSAAQIEISTTVKL